MTENTKTLILNNEIKLQLLAAKLRIKQLEKQLKDCEDKNEHTTN